MTAVTYTASRSLIGGHSVGVDYSLNLSVLEDGLTERVEVQRRVVEPISKRNAEIIRFGNCRVFDVSLAPLEGSALAAVREFLDSCEDAEFDFDAYGSVASPVAPFVARMGNDGYTLSRSLARGTGGAADYFKISFQVVEQ